MDRDHGTARTWQILVGMVAVFGLVLSTTVGFAGAQEPPVVVYDSIGPDLPPNVPSQPFEAQQVNELGDLITLAPGPRHVSKVSVVLSSLECESGTGTPQCQTAPGATFQHPMTMKLYNVAGTPAAPTVGPVIASVTHTMTIPYRPSADPACNGGWMASTGECQGGIAVVVDFTFPAGIVVPDTLIWAISYNTQSAGYEPTGTDGPYNNLNVGVLTITPEPTVGIDIDEDVVFISSPLSDGDFVAEADWTGFRPLALIETQVPAPDTPVTTAAPPSSTPASQTPTSPGASDPTGATAAPLAGAPLSIAG